MHRMAGYPWAVTGSALAVTAIALIDLGRDICFARSGVEFLVELAGIVFAAVLFGAYSWVFAFLVTWPLFLLTRHLADILRTNSLSYFSVSGALAGGLLSFSIVALLNGVMSERSFAENATRALLLGAIYGASGGSLFWWKVARHTPSA